MLANLPEDYQERVHGALKDHDVGAEAEIEHGLNEQSPYPEVQAAVRNYDEVGFHTRFTYKIFGL